MLVSPSQRSDAGQRRIELLTYFENRIKISERFASRALYKASRKGQYEIENRVLFYLIRIAVSAGDYMKIQDLIKQLDIQHETKFHNHQMLHHIVIGWFYSVIGQWDKVVGWIKNNFDKSNIGLVLSGLENLSKMKYYLAEKKYYELLAFLESKENIYGIKCFLMGKIAMLRPLYIVYLHLVFA